MRAPAEVSPGRLIASALVVVALLAGCTGPPSAPARVSFTASWEPWEGDPVEHLVLRMRNTGDAPASLGPGGVGINITGPHGAVPLAWAEAHGARVLAPGEDLVLALHPRMPEDGRMTLALDHAGGSSMPPPAGPYTVCVQGDCIPTEVSG